MFRSSLMISKTIHFDSAHKNPDKGGKYARLHGHTFFLRVYAKGEVHKEYGWIVDFADLKNIFVNVINKLDHSYLNDIPELADDATLPAIKNWIISQVASPPEWLAGIDIGIVGDLSFKPRILDPDGEFPTLWCFSFESAQRLVQLPKTHPCHNLHGHSYFVKVNAEDMNILPQLLHRIYETLDHKLLNEIPGLEKATSEYLAEWIAQKLFDWGCLPNVVIIQETLTSSAIW
ncbi:MAG: 6-carboxytetrahydropterin synthase, partial [Candidatus Hydrogenedentes bacterium]|nr:6-carboxytetrahydropterin synthase [Candidatus Hydrogenedentota bacterium]